MRRRTAPPHAHDGPGQGALPPMATSHPGPVVSSTAGGPAQRLPHAYRKHPEQSLALPRGLLRDPAHPSRRANMQTDLPAQKATGAPGVWGKQMLTSPDAVLCGDGRGRL